MIDTAKDIRTPADALSAARRSVTHAARDILSRDTSPDTAVAVLFIQETLEHLETAYNLLGVKESVMLKALNTDEMKELRRYTAELEDNQIQFDADQKTLKQAIELLDSWWRGEKVGPATKKLLDEYWKTHER